MQAAQSHHRSPPPSYCSGDAPEGVVATVSRSSSHVPVIDSRQSSPLPATSPTPAHTPTSAARTTPNGGPARTAAHQLPVESFQSLDNIDLAIFGSSAAVFGSSSVLNGPAVVAGGAQTSADGGGGVVLDVSAVFTGSRPPTRLMTPRFRPRTQRHVFDPTALYSVEETSVKTWERTRNGGLFTHL